MKIVDDVNDVVHKNVHTFQHLGYLTVMFYKESWAAVLSRNLGILKII